MAAGGVSQGVWLGEAELRPEKGGKWQRLAVRCRVLVEPINRPTALRSRGTWGWYSRAGVTMLRAYVAHAACVCVQVLAGVKERLEASDKTIASWAEEKPWIKEEDIKDVTEKVSSVLRALLTLSTK